MEKEQLKTWLELIKEAAVEAGEEILFVYNSDEFKVVEKDDKSPLTLADQKAHNKIMEYLESTNIPVLSEEGKSVAYEERQKWEYFWMVDPLDGTKEFIKRNGEFTVNIALIYQNTAIMGVVYTPVKRELYYALQGEGAYKITDHQEVQELKIPPLNMNKKGIRVVGSRSHMNEATLNFTDQLDEPEVVSMGSSLKFMVLAEGNADIYPRFAPTMEWDTAAAHAVVSEAGGKVINWLTKEPLMYNKEDLTNPWFLVS